MDLFGYKRMMKYILIVFSILIVGCSFNSIRYISDPTGSYYLSYFPYHDENDNRYVILTYGKLDNKHLPEAYLRIRDKAFDGWKCLIKWKQDTAIVYEPYNQFQPVGLSAEKRLQHVKMVDSVFYKIYYDSSNISYLRLKNE